MITSHSIGATYLCTSHSSCDLEFRMRCAFVKPWPCTLYMFTKCDTVFINTVLVLWFWVTLWVTCLGFIVGGLKFHIELICTGSRELYILFHTEEVIVRYLQLFIICVMCFKSWLALEKKRSLHLLHVNTKHKHPNHSVLIFDVSEDKVWLSMLPLPLAWLLLHSCQCILEQRFELWRKISNITEHVRWHVWLHFQTRLCVGVEYFWQMTKIWKCGQTRLSSRIFDIHCIDRQCVE